MISRRNFLTTSAAVGAALALPSSGMANLSSVAVRPQTKLRHKSCFRLCCLKADIKERSGFYHSPTDVYNAVESVRWKGIPVNILIAENGSPTVVRVGMASSPAFYGPTACRSLENRMFATIDLNDRVPVLQSPNRSWVLQPLFSGSAAKRLDQNKDGIYLRDLVLTEFTLSSVSISELNEHPHLDGFLY